MVVSPMVGVSVVVVLVVVVVGWGGELVLENKAS